jgi:plasmid stabilization system protein ParE
MRLRWLPEAEEDIQRLFAFLVDKNPAAAARAIELIKSGADRLLDMPETGWPMSDDTQRRELYLPFGAGSYILRYILDGDCIVIIRVWHSRE